MTHSNLNIATTENNGKQMTQNIAGISLTELMQNALNANKDQQTSTPHKTNKYTKNITPSRPPHGTRRAMGKR